MVNRINVIGSTMVHVSERFGSRLRENLEGGGESYPAIVGTILI
jgi:hypothetical protein